MLQIAVTAFYRCNMHIITLCARMQLLYDDDDDALLTWSDHLIRTSAVQTSPFSSGPRERDRQSDDDMFFCTWNYAGRGDDERFRSRWEECKTTDVLRYLSRVGKRERKSKRDTIILCIYSAQQRVVREFEKMYKY